jgi:hypothetical protein
VLEPGESEFTAGRAPSEGLTGIAGVTVRRVGRPLPVPSETVGVGVVDGLGAVAGADLRQ